MIELPADCARSVLKHGHTESGHDYRHYHVGGDAPHHHRGPGAIPVDIVAEVDDKTYSRELLVQTLIAHQRLETGPCCCGWDKVGGAFSEHVADEYEKWIEHLGPVLNDGSQ
jgi:hypothetical protein